MKQYLLRYVDDRGVPLFLRAPPSQRNTTGCSWVRDPDLATIYGSEEAALGRYSTEQTRESGVSDNIHPAFRASWLGIAFAECPHSGLREHRVNTTHPECRTFREITIPD